MTDEALIDEGKSAAIEFDRLVYEVPGGRTILDDISLRIERGTATALLGRSGSGKTTLLRTVNRMQPVTSGEVRVRGRSVAQSDPIALRRSIGYVIQETGLFPHFTVERNIGLVLEVEGKRQDEIAPRARELMDTVGLDGAQFARRLPHQLSGGQRQRVGLARALAAGQDILLMDEPFGALDPLTRAEMQDVMRGIMKRMPVTVLLVTHDLDEALYLAERVVLVSEGKIAADLPAQEFLHSDQPAVREYVVAVHRGTGSRGDGHAQAGAGPLRGRDAP
ncbi:MAG: ATP-binding cassette domain-containing protein [Acidobacteriaceae bacterium]